MQRDYIMRLVEQIAALLASVVAKERAGKLSEAKADLDEKARQNIGMNFRDLKRLSPEAVSQLLDSSGGLRYGRAVILAELLLHDAALSETNDQSSDALLSYLHAFCLLSDTMETLTEEDQTVYRPKLEELATRLRSLPPHPYLGAKLAQYDADQSAS
jgi:hypothetical protein